MKIGFSAIQESTYGVIPHLQRQFMVGIENGGGIPVYCLHIEDTKGLDAFLLVNSVPLDTQQHILNNVGQFWTILLDAPFHHANWIMAGSPSIHYAMIDSTHPVILSHLGRSGIFLPHGGTTHAFRPWKDRDIDVFFSATAPDVAQLRRQFSNLNPDAKHIAELLIHHALLSPHLSLFDLFAGIFKQAQRVLTVDEVMFLLTCVDHYVRGTRRLQLLEAFSDFSVVIAGAGWDNFQLSPRHRWIGEVPFRQIPHLMSRAKLVLCPHCGFSHGAHERILTAMGCGAVALTMPTAFLQTSFHHGEQLAYFDHPQEAADLARLILQDPRWEAIGEAGHHLVSAQHTWVNRGEQFMEFLTRPSSFSSSSALQPCSPDCVPTS